MFEGNKTVSKETAVRLIENYGIRQKQRELIELQGKYGGYSGDIEAAISRMNEDLDRILKTILREGKTSEVLS